MWVLSICYPSYAPSDTTVHLRCLKNSALQLSSALRKYFLSFMEQQSEMPNIMKEVRGAAGKWTLISLCLSSTLITWSSPLPHLKFVSLEVEQACQTAFFIFLSSLLIARGIGEEWSFYMLGVFFNTVLLSPLFFPLPAYIPSHVKSNLSSLIHLKLIFLCSYIYLSWKVPSLLKLYSYSFNAITRFF